MKFQLISMRLGKDADKILKGYPKLDKVTFNKRGKDLFIEINCIKDLTNAIKQNVVVCHDEDVIHIFDEKLK